MRSERLEHRLRRRWRQIQFLERFAPPGEADPAHHRVAARGKDFTQSDVKTPEGVQGRPQGGRHISEDELAVGVERAGQR